jgi:hypothetical protein
MRDAEDREGRLDRVLASFIDEAESGAPRDRREWLIAYPEFFDELSDFFADRDAIERIAAPLRDAALAGRRELVPDWLDPPAHPEHLGSLAGYEVIDWLGRGGMGVVFKAFDPALNRYVAVKVLAPQWSPDLDARRRFTREARAAAAISHPHVITIHAVGEWKGRPYLVMEYVPGASLQQRIDEGRLLGVAEVLRIGMQAASGLAEAHAQGLVHRDIKPSNVMLESDLERVKITDFGLARAVDDTFLTQHGTLAGTPRYMAPEQARGERLDRRADLFSLGGVLYALCTGRPAFDGDSTPAVIRNVCEATPTPVRELNPDVPAWLAEIIERLLEKDPAARFQSASELADLLARHLAQLQDPSLPPVEHPWTKGPSRLARLARGAARGARRLVPVALVACGLAGLYTALRPPRAAGPRLGRVYHQDFRTAPLDERAFRAFGRDDDPSRIRSEPKGLHMTVPVGRRGDVGLVTTFGVRGDFEITAAFEVLPTAPPSEGYGTGPELLIKPLGGWDTFASMARLRRESDAIDSLVHGWRVDGESRMAGRWPAAVASSGRFRLARTGETLRYLVADGPSGDFQEFFRTKFGAQDIEQVRFKATAGGGLGPVEVIWDDLTIRAEALPEPDGDTAPAGPR